ncbi:MAG: hypothetical protein ACFFBH_04515 [Promethearchaeota archaeon]
MPLSPLEQPIFITLTVVVTSIFNILIEYGVVYGFLKSSILVKHKLFSSVTLVNLTTFPPTNTIAYLFVAFYLGFYAVYVIIISIVVTLIDCVLYYLEFQKLFYRNSIKNQPSIKRTILISSLANSASFSVIYLWPIIASILFT